MRWADALSVSVRPVITYWFMLLYCAAKRQRLWLPLPAAGGARRSCTPGRKRIQALWARVLNFWFLGRVFDRVRP